MRIIHKLLAIALSLMLAFSAASFALAASAAGAGEANVKPLTKPFTPGSISYPEGITQQQALQALQQSDPALLEILKLLLPEIEQAGGLKNAVKGQLATNEMAGQAIVALYTGLETLLDQALSSQPILSQAIKNQLTPANVAARLTEEQYANAGKALSAAGLTWQTAELSTVNWGFSDGDLEGFLDAVIAGLRPVTNLLLGSPILSLIGIDISFANTTDDEGVVHYGLYEKLFIPIYEALGITDAPTSAAYTEQAQQAIDATGHHDAYLKLALAPLLPLIDTLLDAPVDTLTQKLPQLVYDSDAVFQAIREVCRSIGFGLEDAAAPYLSLEGLFGLAQGVLQHLEIEGQSISLTLPEVDWELLASLGELATIPTMAAGYTHRQSVKADQPAVFVTLLRYAQEALTQNRAEIERLIGSMEGAEEALPIIEQVLDGLSEKDALPILLIELLAPQEPEPEEPSAPSEPGTGEEEESRPEEGGSSAPGDGVEEPTNPPMEETETSPIENPSTGGEALPAALLAAVAGAAILLVLSRKRSADPA